MNDKHLKINVLLIFKNYMNFTIKGVCYIHSPLLVGEIQVRMARFYYQNSDLKCHAYSDKNTNTKITVLTVNSGHMGSYLPSGIGE